MSAVTSMLVGWLVVVAAFDLGARRVPNWLLVTGLAAGLLALSAASQPLGISWTQAMTAGVLAGGFFLIFYALGLMGAGDVKFAVVLGVWFGGELLVTAWVVASLIALSHSLLVMAARRMPWLTASFTDIGIGAGITIEGQPVSARKRQVPYAAYLAIGALVAMQTGY